MTRAEREGKRAFGELWDLREDTVLQKCVPQGQGQVGQRREFGVEVPCSRSGRREVGGHFSAGTHGSWGARRVVENQCLDGQ